MHLSFDACRSILTEFCFTATRLQEMRHFIKSVYTLRERRRNRRTGSTRSPIFVSRTLEAFAEAVDEYIRDIDKWCASKEEAIVQARSGTGRQMVATLLSCCYEMKEEITSTLEITQDILRQLIKRELCKDGATHHRGDVEKLGFLRAKDFSSIPPFVLSTRILDLLLQAINTQLAIGELSAASRLTTIFVKTAEPVWKRAGQWMKDGMKVGATLDMDSGDENELDIELFIRRQEIDFTNPDFWEQGYVLRCEGDDNYDESQLDTPSRPLLVPDIFANVAHEILATGKAVGLLRAIGIEPFVEGESQWSALEWGSFTDIYNGSQHGISEAPSPSRDEDSVDLADNDATYSSRLAMGSLHTTLVEHIFPWCKSANAKLNRLLLEECSMMEHLSAIENFYFMRQGDAMTAFCDQVFSKVRFTMLKFKGLC
jgi:gamma-tubulin complex component 5